MLMAEHVAHQYPSSHLANRPKGRDAKPPVYRHVVQDSGVATRQCASGNSPAN